MLNNQSWHQLAGATPQAHNHVQQPQQPLPQPGAQGQPLPSWTAPSQQHQLGAQHPLAPAQQQQQQSWAATQHQQQPLNAPQQHQQWQPLPPAEEERVPLLLCMVYKATLIAAAAIVPLSCSLDALWWLLEANGHNCLPSGLAFPTGNLCQGLVYWQLDPCQNEGQELSRCCKLL